MSLTNPADRLHLGCQAADDGLQPLGIEHIGRFGKRSQGSACDPELALHLSQQRSLLQGPQRPHQGTEQKQQHQDAVLIVVQLAIARPVSLAAHVVQLAQQRQQLLQVLQALNVTASKDILTFGQPIASAKLAAACLLSCGAQMACRTAVQIMQV